MLKRFSLFLALCFVFGLALANNQVVVKNSTELYRLDVQNAQVQRLVNGSVETPKSRDEGDLFYEDFEGDMSDWTNLDATDLDPSWHRSSTGAYEGESWWMGDETIGGYDNTWYQALDTPPIDLTQASGNLTLTFKLAHNLEGVAGAEAPYTGWDGCNVRISTDGGSTFTVLTPTTPAYTATSMYSFGLIHGEGANVPGWAGDSEGWTDASFDLSNYSDETNVVIRFAFASDGAASTADGNGDASWFGMRVDNINVADVYTNDASADGNMVPQWLVPLGGDLWHVGTEATAPSPSHALILSNDQNTYNPSMENYYISPSVELPADSYVFCDFMVRGVIGDNDEHPNTDYWRVEVSPDNGETWNALSNPTGDPDGDNYVHGDAPEEWFPYSQAYTDDAGQPMTNISGLAGNTVKFRFYFHSDDDTPIGTGMMFDNFRVWAESNIPAIEDLTATSGIGNGGVQLAWTDPSNPGGGEEIGYTQADPAIEAGWCLSTRSLEVGVIFPANNVSAIKIYAYEGSTQTTLKAWPIVDGSPSDDGPMAGYEVTVNNITANSWNTIELDTPWEFDETFAISLESSSTYYIPADPTSAPSVHSFCFHPANDQQGNPIGDRWFPYSQVASAYSVPDGEIAIHIITEGDPQIFTYNIYRSEDNSEFTQIATGVEGGEYLDASADEGTVYYYTIKAANASGTEGPESNLAYGYTLPADAQELSYDDNAANSDAPNPGTGGKLAVRFEPSQTPTYLYMGEFYINDDAEAGRQFIIQVLEDNNGEPGDQIAMFTGNQPLLNQTGWTPICLTEEAIQVDGPFFLAIMLPSTAPTFAIDSDNTDTGISFQQVPGGTTWTDISQFGNLMFRAVVSSTNGSEVIMPSGATMEVQAQNYPNPFNPDTQIEFTVPQAGNVKVNVYNVKGEKVKTLANAHMESGMQQVHWNGTNAQGENVASGVYFYRIQGNNLDITKKMMLMK